MSDERSPRFSEEQVKSVIARAMELDADRHLTTADELRAIAAEVGISRDALDAAMREQGRGIELDAPQRARRAATLVVASGVPLGITAAVVLGTASPLSILSGLGIVAIGLVASGALVIAQGRHASIRSFQVRNFALWSGIAVGSAFVMRLFPGGNVVVQGIILGWCLRSWVASSILGSAAVIAVRRAGGTSGGTRGGSGPSAGREPLRTRFLRTAKRAMDWLSRTFRRNAGFGSPTTPHPRLPRLLRTRA